MTYLTPSQVAERLSIDAGTVRAMCRAGKLRHVRVGTGNMRPRYRIPASALTEIELESPRPRESERLEPIVHADDYLETWRSRGCGSDAAMHAE